MSILKALHIPCDKCKKPAGEFCGRWETAPTICQDRIDKALKDNSVRNSFMD